MKITVLNNIGFCNGVNHSLRIVEDNYQSNEPTYLLGMLVHNEIINDELAKNNIKIISEVNALNLKQGTIITTAHGTKDELLKKLKETTLKIIDTTCPIVKQNEELINRYLNDGFTIIYLGIKNHPESKALENKTIIVQNADDIDNLLITNNRIVIISQTTMTEKKIDELTKKIIERYPFVLIDTKICPFVLQRQKEIDICAAKNHSPLDFYLVLGSKLSNNTNSLLEIIHKYTNNAYIISSINDLYALNLKDRYHLYLTSGTSTPMSFIREVMSFLEKKS